MYTNLNTFIRFLSESSSNCRPAESFCRDEARCIPSVWLGSSEDCTGTAYVFSCPFNKYKCPTEDKCIENSWKCDHDWDCENGEDELGCIFPSVVCSSNQYRCPDEDKCINLDWKCDGDWDCPNGADESC